MIQIICGDRYVNERKYLYEVIFREWLGLPYEIAFHDAQNTIIRFREVQEEKEIIIQDGLFCIPKEKWLTDDSLPSAPLHSLNLSHFPFVQKPYYKDLPLIYGTKESSVNVSDTKIEINWDLFGSIFFMLTRYEEVVKKTYDKHGRFNSHACVVRDLLHRPLVNEYVELLWECLQRAWPKLKRRNKHYNLFLSHDVDHPSSFLDKPISAVLKTTMGDLLKRKDPILFARRFGSYLPSRFGNHQFDPYNTFDFIMKVSEKNNIKSAFYFIAGNTAGNVDGYYNLDMPFIRQLMRTMHFRGHEIGLHPSYDTYLSRDNLQKEFDNLLRVTSQEGIKQEHWGGRQHYLRWQAPITWQTWEDVGLSYDSSLGFAENIGFRCGTCYDFPVFNLLSSSALKLREYPLIVMEETLLGKNYQNKTLSQAYEAIIELSHTVRYFKGTFTLLWHNSMLASSDQKIVYKNIIESIV